MDNMALYIKTAAAAAVGVAVHWLGGLDQLLTTLIVVIVLDYITGLLSAIHNRTLSSAIGFRGIAKKVLCLAVVALAFVLEALTGYALALREMVIVFFIANEGISVLENAAETGLPLPGGLLEVLSQLKHGKEKRNEQ